MAYKHENRRLILIQATCRSQFKCGSNNWINPLPGDKF